MTRPLVNPENLGTRPRIRPATIGPNNVRRLLCVGYGAYGYGNTPNEAYQEWQHSRHYVLHTHHRNVNSNLEKKP